MEKMSYKYAVGQILRVTVGRYSGTPFRIENAECRRICPEPFPQPCYYCKYMGAWYSEQQVEACQPLPEVTSEQELALRRRARELLRTREAKQFERPAEYVALMLGDMHFPNGEWGTSISFATRKECAKQEWNAH